MNNNRIALNIIVKNEEKFLKGCLESVKNLVDEIVIADTGSTDNTIEIASKYTDKILYFNWTGDFSEARNFVLNNTDSEWILYLDADERIDSKYHNKIKELVKRTDVDAYQLRIRSLIKDGNNIQVHIVPYPRLFRKIENVKFEGKIHEQITPSLLKAGAKFESTDIVIEHLGYSQSDEIIEAKKKRNLEALIEQVKNEPKNAYALFQLGQNYITLGYTEDGIRCLTNALKLNTLTNPVKATILSTLAKYQYDKRNIDSAIDLCKLSLQIAPSQLFAKLLLSEILFSIKKVEESIALLKEALVLAKIPENTRKIDVATDISYDPSFINYLLGQRFQVLGMLDEAIQSYKEALEFKKDFYEVMLELAGIYFYKQNFDKTYYYLNKINIDKIKNEVVLMNFAGLFDELKKYKECKNVLKKVIELNPENAKAHFFIGNCYLYESNLEKAEEYFLNAFKLQPQVPETIMNLAYVNIKKKNYISALDYYRILESMNPDDQDIKQKIKALELKILLENNNLQDITSNDRK